MRKLTSTELKHVYGGGDYYGGNSGYAYGKGGKYGGSGGPNGEPGGGDYEDTSGTTAPAYPPEYPTCGY